MPRRRRAKPAKSNPESSKKPHRRRARRSRSMRRRRAESALAPARRNPAGGMLQEMIDAGMFVGVGFAGFAAGRFVTRAVSLQVAKRSEKWAKHAGVAGGLVTFLAATFLARRWKVTEKYQTELQVGAGMALAQTIVQTYLPQLGWIVSDCNPQLPSATAATAEQSAAASPQSTGFLPDDEDDDAYPYNDAYDHGRFSKPPQPAAPRAAAPPPPEDESVDDMLADLDDVDDGIFTQAN